MWELDYKESWALKNWCLWTVVLEKTLESPLDCKEIKPVYPKGNQKWIFIERTDVEAPILWPRDAKNWLIGKDPYAGKDRRQKKGTTEDEMVGWHHQLNGCESEQAPGVGVVRWSPVCCSPWGHRVGHDWATELNWTTFLALCLFLVDFSVCSDLCGKPNSKMILRSPCPDSMNSLCPRVCIGCWKATSK